MELIYIIGGFLLFGFIVSKFSKKGDEYDAAERKRKDSNEIESRRKGSVDYFEECRRKTLEESKTNAPEPMVIQAQLVPKKEKLREIASVRVTDFLRLTDEEKDYIKNLAINTKLQLFHSVDEDGCQGDDLEVYTLKDNNYIGKLETQFSHFIANRITNVEDAYVTNILFDNNGNVAVDIQLIYWAYPPLRKPEWKFVCDKVERYVEKSKCLDLGYRYECYWMADDSFPSSPDYVKYLTQAIEFVKEDCIRENFRTGKKHVWWVRDARSGEYVAAGGISKSGKQFQFHDPEKIFNFYIEKTCQSYLDY